MSGIPIEPNYELHEPIYFGNGRLFLHDSDGHRVFLDPNEQFMTLHMIEHHQWEPHVRQIIAASVTGGVTCVDVGANIGLHTLYMAGFIGSTGRIYAVEPNPAVMKILKTNMEINGFLDRTTFVEKAVSDHEGTADFYVYEGHDGMSGLMPEQNHFDIEPSALQVDITSLRSIVPDGVQIHLLKIDVEGFEYAALMGAGDLLDSPELTVIFEWLPDDIRDNSGEKAMDDTLNLLRAKGFKLYYAAYQERLRRIDGLDNSEIKLLFGDIVATRKNHLDQFCEDS